MKRPGRGGGLNPYPPSKLSSKTQRHQSTPTGVSIDPPILTISLHSKIYSPLSLYKPPSPNEVEDDHANISRRSPPRRDQNPGWGFCPISGLPVFPALGIVPSHPDQMAKNNRRPHRL